MMWSKNELTSPNQRGVEKVIWYYGRLNAAPHKP